MKISMMNIHLQRKHELNRIISPDAHRVFWTHVQRDEEGMDEEDDEDDEERQEREAKEAAALLQQEASPHRSASRRACRSWCITRAPHSTTAPCRGLLFL